MPALQCQIGDIMPANDTAPATGSVIAFRGGRALSDREVHAIAVGRADAFRFGWSAQAPRSRVARWIAVLTGIRNATPFADARLEALRLFACMLRRDDRRLDELGRRLVAGGYSRAALRQAISLALA